MWRDMRVIPAPCGEGKEELLRRLRHRNRRGIGELSRQLRVARLGVLHRLLLDRAIAADLVRQRQHVHRGVVRPRRQHRKHGRHVVLVAGDQFALELAVRVIAEQIERRAAQAAQLRQRAEQRQHPAAELPFLRPARRVDARQARRREMEADLEVALELLADALLEGPDRSEPRHLVLVLVGEQLGVVDRHRARQRFAIVTASAAPRT